jgi:hypothetical protein
VNGQPQQQAEIATAIERLNGRDWDKAVETLVAIGEPAVGPLIAAGWGSLILNWRGLCFMSGT